MNVVLEKYHGLGNDYLVFDPNKNEMELNEENVRLLCDRNYGIGAVSYTHLDVYKRQGFVIAYLILGGKIVLQAAKNLKKGHVFDENFLMSIATLAAFAIGDFAEDVYKRQPRWKGFRTGVRFPSGPFQNLSIC